MTAFAAGAGPPENRMATLLILDSGMTLLSTSRLDGSLSGERQMNSYYVAASVGEFQLPLAWKRSVWRNFTAYSSGFLTIISVTVLKSSFDQRGVECPGDKVGVVEHLFRQRDRRLNALNNKLADRATHTRQRFFTSCSVHNQFTNH